MDIDPESLTREQKALLARVAEHLRKLRMEHASESDSNAYQEGILSGIEIAKNELWRLSGSRPF